jgi:hypothetical protein
MNVFGVKVLGSRKTTFQAQMILGLMIVSGTLLLAFGCGKKDESAGAATSAVSTAPSASGVQPGGADMEAALRELTKRCANTALNEGKCPRRSAKWSPQVMCNICPRTARQEI